jgi:hypothetical protein
LRRDYSEIYNDLDPDLLKEGNIQRIEEDELMIIEPTQFSMMPQFNRFGMSTMDRGTMPQANYMDSRVNAYQENRKRRGMMATQTPLYSPQGFMGMEGRELQNKVIPQTPVPHHR